jgi:succinate dehydrogenase/fumarate reductase-like Fe-S protein
MARQGTTRRVNVNVAPVVQAAPLPAVKGVRDLAVDSGQLDAVYLAKADDQVLATNGQPGLGGTSH